MMNTDTPVPERLSAQLPPPDALVVLIVDDVPDNVALLHDALDEAGYTVLVALDGEAAIRRATQALPDVILLDAVMPGIDGYEAAARMRALPGSGDLVMVALSGYAQPGDRQRSQQAGFDLHLAKPLDLERLRDLLAAVGTGRAQFRDDFDRPAIEGWFTMTAV